MPYALGIDLGSGRITAAISRNDRERWLKPEVVALDGDPAGVASVLHVTDQDAVEVGSAALRALPARAGWVARDVASRIGDEIPVTLGGRPYPAEVLTAAVVGWVVDQVEATEGVPASQLVVTHPAGWGIHRRGLLQGALREVNLPEPTLLPRPVAAAESHAGTQRVEVGEEIAVYSLGSGRFESAVLRRGSFGFELRAHADGIEPVGGTLFDDLLAEHVLGALKNAPDGVAAAKLRLACTAAKERLSVESSVSVSGVRVTRAEFEELIRPAVESTVESLRRTIRSAGGETVGTVVLVGGCGRIPLVTELVAAGTRARVAAAADPETSIARGAAVAASRMAKPTVRATALTMTPEPIARSAVTHTDLMRLDELPEEDLTDLGPPPPRPPVELAPLEPPKRRLLPWGGRDKEVERPRRRSREDREFADLDLASATRRRKRKSAAEDPTHSNFEDEVPQDPSPHPAPDPTSDEHSEAFDPRTGSHTASDPADLFHPKSRNAPDSADPLRSKSRTAPDPTDLFHPKSRTAPDPANPFHPKSRPGPDPADPFHPETGTGSDSADLLHPRSRRAADDPASSRRPRSRRVPDDELADPHPPAPHRSPSSGEPRRRRPHQTADDHPEPPGTGGEPADPTPGHLAGPPRRRRDPAARAVTDAPPSWDPDHEPLDADSPRRTHRPDQPIYPGGQIDTAPEPLGHDFPAYQPIRPREPVDMHHPADADKPSHRGHGPDRERATDTDAQQRRRRPGPKREAVDIHPADTDTRQRNGRRAPEHEPPATHLTDGDQPPRRHSLDHEPAVPRHLTEAASEPPRRRRTAEREPLGSQHTEPEREPRYPRRPSADEQPQRHVLDREPLGSQHTEPEREPLYPRHTPTDEQPQRHTRDREPLGSHHAEPEHEPLRPRHTPIDEQPRRRRAPNREAEYEPLQPRHPVDADDRPAEPPRPRRHRYLDSEDDFAPAPRRADRDGGRR